MHAPTRTIRIRGTFSGRYLEMNSQLGTKIIDGDGHIMEDNPGIIAHMASPYREIAQRKGIIFPPLDHLHAGRAVETPPQRDQRPAVGPIFSTMSVSNGLCFILPSGFPTAKLSASTTRSRSPVRTTTGFTKLM